MSLACLQPFPLGENGQSAPCGNCAPCLRTAQLSRTGRILYEARQWPITAAHTLTFRDEPEESTEVLHAVQDMLKAAKRKHGKFQHHYIVETGDRHGRLHSHCITFGWSIPGPYDRNFNSPIWPHGFVFKQAVNRKTARYIAGHDTDLEKQPLHTSRTSIGKGLIEEIALNLLARQNHPSWNGRRIHFDFKIGGKRYPLTRHQNEKIRDRVLELGGQWPVDGIAMKALIEAQENTQKAIRRRDQDRKMAEHRDHREKERRRAAKSRNPRGNRL